MAESKDGNKDDQSDNFADDLDAMLNDVDMSTDDQEELINDDDAIDRLLMDDDLVSSDEIMSTEAGQRNIENEVAEEIEDEFSEDNLESLIDAEIKTEKEPEKEISTELEIESSNEKNEMDEFDPDDLIAAVASTEESPKEDEFAEIDEFSGDGENEVVENIIEPEPEPEPEADSDSDFLMADFDISSDDELEEDEFSETEAEEEQASEMTDEVDSVLLNEPDNDNNSEGDISAKVQKETEKMKLDIDQLREQVSNLVADNNDLNQQLAVIVSDMSKAKDDSIATDIDALQSEQRKLRKTIKESDAKVPIVTYIALGIAILALLLGGGLGAIGYGAKSDTEALAELVTIIEEEVEIVSARDFTADVKKINDKLSLLVAKDDHLNKQLIRLEKLIKKNQSNPLEPVVDDLVEQNDHAQQAIELLLAKVDTLEQGKIQSSRKTKSKKIIPKVKWVVNLVSFKQAWYAKRKAEEFEKKGIFSKVIQVKVKGENWFRLTVEGFKSKYEAAAYAVKAKKALNLISVWVTKA